jgi:Malonate decarboxylase gamma subunit (MdcE)
VVGHALSGAFLTHGYQGDRILAFDDDGVMIHATHKETAARVTGCSVDELENLAMFDCPLFGQTWCPPDDAENQNFSASEYFLRQIAIHIQPVTFWNLECTSQAR